MDYLCLNDKFILAREPLLFATNRAYRYGDGLFETMKVEHASIQLPSYHFERLFAGLHLLSYAIPALFTPEKIAEQILQLCEKNKCSKLARVRLSVSRGNGGLYDGDRKLQYIIECWPLEKYTNALNENGLVTGIYPHARKSCDIFSNLKTASFLPYALAADYARQNRLNDCFILNSYDRLADSTIANVFMIKDERVITPPLSEGCVNGVMRRSVLEQLPKAGFVCEEAPITPKDLMNAEEVFLTNAIRGIRWVKQVDDKMFACDKTAAIFNRLTQTI